MRGTFYGIGVGPGDPELLTVKAIKAIEAADVLIAPKTEKKEGSVALEIARPYLKKDIEIVYQVFPMVKDFAEDTGAWEANKEEILALLRAGKNVAFLTLGDPMFFSTYIYVFRLLEHEDYRDRQPRRPPHRRGQRCARDHSRYSAAGASRGGHDGGEQRRCHEGVSQLC